MAQFGSMESNVQARSSVHPTPAGAGRQKKGVETPVELHGRG